MPGRQLNNYFVYHVNYDGDKLFCDKIYAIKLKKGQVIGYMNSMFALIRREKVEGIFETFEEAIKAFPTIYNAGKSKY